MEARERAVARFLHENLPRTPGDARWPWLAERENLQQQLESLEHKLAKSVSERDETVDSLKNRLDELHRELAKSVSERDETRSALDKALSQLVHFKRSRLLKVGRLLRRIAGLQVPY